MELVANVYAVACMGPAYNMAIVLSFRGASKWLVLKCVQDLAENPVCLPLY